MTAATQIRVGTASWTDHEPFYPPEYSRADMKSRRIEYYSRYFSVVEVDSTYYSMQPARNFAMWAERTPDDFVFDVKAYSELTWHHRDENGRGQPPSSDTFARYSEMVQPLREAGKMGAVLFQFPPWFTYSDEGLDYLPLVRESLPKDTIAVEFRHRSWLEGDHVERTKAALTDARLAYCAVDEPQVGSGSVPPVAMVTDPAFSMVRFHGRNRATWYGKGLSSSRQRYDYLYSPDELRPWVERVQRIAEQLSGAQVHVIANNNASNYGIVNALDLQDLLGQPIGGGHPLPEGVLTTIRERDGRIGDAPAPKPQETLWPDTE
jgi:uncharacterized protein YecE (DUF72 family)